MAKIDDEYLRERWWTSATSANILAICSASTLRRRQGGLTPIIVADDIPPSSPSPRPPASHNPITASGTRNPTISPAR